MTLGNKQRLFAKLVPRLIDFIYASGYECTLGEAYRTPEQAAIYASQGKGIKNSAHEKKLALDLNLFKDGIYLTATADYKPIGEYWKTLTSADAECCWGGDFSTLSDGNHFSIAHDGMK